MYSNSSSYLGGANSGRPGGSPFNSQPPPQYAQQQPQSQFSSQATGFGAGGLQPQYTGYPGQQQPQLQSQYTGYPPQNAASLQQQQQPPPIPQQQQPFQTGYQQSVQPLQQPPQQQQQPMQTGFQAPPGPSPAPKQLPQPTGFAAMAASFRSSPAPAVSSMTSTNTRSNKIPNVRLSFITADDQAKFEQLFKSATGTEQAISGDKARDVLLRSKLPGDSLSQIWMLSDTTKSGQLLFPEFALSMYLCNLKMNGKTLPATLPEKIKNEVSSMVDIISFGVPDDSSRTTTRSNAPSFEEAPRQSSFASQPMQQPQAQQPSNAQLLSQLTAQPTGYLQQQQFQPQPTGLPPQQTGYMQPQATSYQGPRPPMPPMPTRFQSQPAAMPLNAQPTGRPGQWGLVNAPASGLPNIQALQSQMMPQAGREGGYTTTGLRGNATVPWAVTKDEKKIYDNLFKSWDGFHKGYITGSQAIEIFSQSGLDKPDLETIWTLSDPNNRGRLDLDEFAVAMHLIYRKLNGYPVPNRLPPELIPPSTRNFNDSIGSIKSLLSRDAEERKNTGAFLQPQQTGVSYLKNHSFARTNGAPTSERKDATVFKNNDDDIGYRSSARRRMGDDGRSPSPALSSPPSEPSDDMSLEQLQKKIREKQVLLDAIDFQDEGHADQDEALDRKDRKDAEDLYMRVRRLQEDIDSHPKASFRGGDSSAERRNLRRKLQGLTDRLPQLASDVRRTEKGIADARLELFRLKDAKAHPGGASAIVGTGPGGAVTESDKLKARSKALMQQRSAALAGRPIPASDDTEGSTRRLDEENRKVASEKENNDRMVSDVEESVGMFSRGVEESLKEGSDDGTAEHEKRRWEDGLGVEDEVKDFIYDLQRSSRASRIRREELPRDRPVKSQPEPAARIESPISRPDSAARSSPAPSNYSSYKTAEERAAYIKQQAEQRMAERLAALGLRAPAKAGETAQQRQERERKDKEDRVRQAEAEDAQREQERQRRLADEQISPPSAAKSTSKAPPPPPSRSKRSDSLQKKAEQEAAQQVLRETQEASQAETKSLENEERRQEAALQKEREASDARRKALEEQVRQGKLKKEEEKKARKAAQRETKEREDRLAAQRAELEAARERERELQRQLESIGDDDSSSDEESPQQITPAGTTPSMSQELPRSVPVSVPLAPLAQAPPIPTTSTPIISPLPALTTPPVISPPASTTSEESRNPYHKMASPASSAQETNPFTRLSMQQSQMVPQRTGSRFDTSAAADDDWSVVDSREQESDDDEDDGPSAGSAKHLASILFGTMAPPKPMSQNVTGNAEPKSPVDRTAVGSPPLSAPSAAEVAPSAPPPPPMPSFGAPPPPPMPSGGAPPPPPMPSGGAPPPPPMPGSFDSAPPPPPMPKAPSAGPPAVGALLGQIQAGRGLKKTVTKDKSTAATAGRVLG